MASHGDPDRAGHRHRDSDTRRKHHKKQRHRDQSSKSTSEGSGSRSRQRLSVNALAQLDEYNTIGGSTEPSRESERRPKRERPRRDEYRPITTNYESPKREHRRRDEHRDRDREYDSPRRERRRAEQNIDSDREYDLTARARPQRVLDDGEESDDRRQRRRERRTRGNKGKRIVSGAIVEEGRANPAMRGGAGSKHSSYNSIEDEKRNAHAKSPWLTKKKKKYIIAVCIFVVIILIIVIGVVVGKKNPSSSTDSGSSSSSGDLSSDVPIAARGTYLDPSTWYDTTDFNTTYTNQTVGGLPIEGLYTKWDDSAKANDKVPALNKDWGDYSTTPARGVNLGGWLSLEPFITPSLFDYDSNLGIIDEWTLTSYLGAKTAASTLEKHYATFVTEDTFQEIQAAGLDHVRIPYSYWAVQTYDDDPYVFRTSWRYLLRGIEWARKYGLRVNLDLHGLPGSQNGWNHSGRQGVVSWLNGTDGDLNAQRSLDVHDRLSQFFAQDRYKNIITFYGLANEPKMVQLSASAVTNWTTAAYHLVRANGLAANVVFGDGFMGIANWQGKLTGLDGLILDVHQYVIFNNEQIIYPHQQKVTYACDGWTAQAEQSLDTTTGYGPTMFAEWSQADADCAQHLNNVGWGSRWEGTYASGNASTQALTPKCPAEDASCSCAGANAAVADYSDEYKAFLLTFAEAQMTSFEKGYGWWYWTWDTESAPQWSYKQGLAAGILPALAYDRAFSCDDDVPDYADEGLVETY
ncbi:glycoside hydrolase family 5 protein [Xylariaceae sp. FL0804]|nr:glycoside hydrolase family 5 protein [Xylariaceae sp. FL0804]